MPEVQELARTRLAAVTGGGTFMEDWGGDIKGAVVPNAGSLVAGAGCFGGVSKWLHGKFFTPPTGRGALKTLAPYAASLVCSSATGTLIHHLIMKK